MIKDFILHLNFGHFQMDTSQYCHFSAGSEYPPSGFANVRACGVS